MVVFQVENPSVPHIQFNGAVRANGMRNNWIYSHVTHLKYTFDAFIRQRYHSHSVGDLKKMTPPKTRAAQYIVLFYRHRDINWSNKHIAQGCDTSRKTLRDFCLFVERKY